MINVLELFGGVGLFLFGMSLMGSSLERMAGSGLEKILQTLTTSKKKGVGVLKGWGLGLGVTGVIQSSAATTIMLIGFVNAGIMTLSQAIPVVYGANVGSTVTAQILRLGDLGSGGIVLQLLKPSSFAPMLLAVGVPIYLFTKKQKVRDITGIMIGLGTLFYGMTMMEEVFAPLKESEQFQSFFLSFSNPILGILTGLALTALIQSSSASVGILQALSATGSVTYGIAVPIIIGQNIGKCMTIILGSIGANKKAKRVALSYLLFNIIGAIIISVIIYSIYYTVGIPLFEKTVNRGNIANIHLGFNLVISLVLMPFSNQMASLTGKILKDSDENPDDAEFRKLDDMLLKTPGIALTQCSNLMNKMDERIQENFALAVGLFTDFDKNTFKTLADNEAFIDKCETVLSTYIVKIDRKRLTPDNRRMLSAMLHTIGDYERIGDYSMSIAYIAQECHESKMSFSERGEVEIETILDAVRHMMKKTFEAAKNEDVSSAKRMLPLASTIVEMKEMMEAHHVERLQEGDCGVAGGVALYDLVNCLERVSLHLKIISKHVIMRMSTDDNIDAQHGRIMDKTSEEYAVLKDYYDNKYLAVIRNVDSVIEDRKNATIEAEKAEAAEVSTATKKSKAEKSKSEKSKSEKSKAEKSKAEKSKAEKSKADKDHKKDDHKKDDNKKIDDKKVDDKKHKSDKDKKQKIDDKKRKSDKDDGKKGKK